MIQQTYQTTKHEAYEIYMDQMRRDYIQDFEMNEVINMILGWSNEDEKDFMRWVIDVEFEKMYDFEDWYSDKYEKIS